MNAQLMPSVPSAAPLPSQMPVHDLPSPQVGREIVRAFVTACRSSVDPLAPPALGHPAGIDFLRPRSAAGAESARAEGMVKIELTLPGDLARLLGSLAIVAKDGSSAAGEYRAVQIGDSRHLRFQLRRAQEPGDVNPERLCLAFRLTRAEAQVLAALASGEQSKRYAARKGVSVHTVHSQIRALKIKMDCRRQIDLVRKVFELERRITPGAMGGAS